MLDWDIFLIQETVVSTEGVEKRKQAHHLHPRTDRSRLERTLAVVVNESCAGKSRFLGSGFRWVAIEVSTLRLTAFFSSAYFL